LLPGGHRDPSLAAGERRIAGLAVIAVALELFARFEGKRLLVAGHTDTAGSEAHNLALSRERALNVRAYLVGEREAWAALCQARFKVEDWQQVLAWVAATFGWETDPGAIDGVSGPRSREALRAFRRRYAAEVAPIPERGVITTADWGAFYDLYERDLARRLSVEVGEL